jgi:hypothetical protein
MFMLSRPCILVAALAFLAAAGAPAAAEIVVGKWAPAVGGVGLVLVFSDDAQGDVAPYRVMSGPASQLASAANMFYDRSHVELFVSDFRGQKISVFPPGAAGDAPPLRSFTSPGMGQPRQVVVVPAFDEVMAIVSTCCVATYSRTANGNVGPQRSIQWGGSMGSLTRLDNPSGLAYRADTDEIYVGDYFTAPVPGEVLVFPRTATGNTAPTRVLSGPNTQLGYVVRIVLHPVLPEMYVLVTTTGSDYRILTFNKADGGDVAPLRAIGGAATLMVNSQGFDYNAATDEFVVLTDSYGGGTPAVRVFPRLGQGNIAPTRSIIGPNAGFTDSDGYGILAADLDPIFADGFDGP